MSIKPDPAPAAPRRARRIPRWVLISAVGLALITVLLGTVAAYLVNRDLPDVRSLEDYQPPTITQILADRGEVVQQFAEQKRIVVPLEKIDPKLREAVIAVEDANFLKHVGVDPWAIARAVLRDIREGRWAEGGSTLTQQLTKILFLRPEKTLRRKVQEAFLAVQIEKTYTKEEILEFYLNQIYTGHGRYGVEAAAQFYFERSSSDLTLDQAALLAGLIQRPEEYSPMRSPERAAQRRNKVLARMLEEGFITQEEAERAKASPVEVSKHGGVEETVAPYFAEEIRKALVPSYGEEALLREGLVIKTGLDLDLQRTANRALSKGLRDLDKRRGFRRPAVNIVLQKIGTLDSYQHPGWARPVQEGDLVTGLVMKVSHRSASIRIGSRTGKIAPEDAAWTERSDLTRLLRPGDLTLFEVRSAGDGELSLTLDQEPEVEGAVLALDPRTGDIKAMVGGFEFGRSQFNRAHQALRQCGSAFKPFIYALAIEEGHTPSDLLLDAPTVYLDPTGGAPYQPENYERLYHGVVTLRRALEESINVPTVTLLNQIGYDRTVQFARRLGITSKLYAYPSLALGSSEVSLMELTAAYGVFPTGGLLARPRYFSEVRDREGNVLEEVAVEGSDVMRADVAAVVVSMMQGVISRGTAAEAASLGTELAGKTGTTDDYTDAWFVGYSPSLVMGVWVGHDKKVSLGPRETGARAALPIWKEIMQDHIKRAPAERFPVSANVVTLPVDRDTGLRVAPELGCRAVVMESFIAGTEVARPCTSSAHLRLSLPYFLQRYPIRGGGRLEVPDTELERLLRENPFHLELLGRSSLNVLSPSGLQVVRLARGGDDGGDVSWGLFGGSSAPRDSDDEDLTSAQLLPADLPPLAVGPHSYLGIDGRAAATVPIRYP